MNAIFNILVFYLLGAIASWLTGGVLPASIAGMILLFVALWSGWLKKERVEKGAKFLIDNLMLFFVPVAVGVFSSFTLFADHIWAIIVSSLVSTVVVIVVVGVTAQQLIKRKEKRR